MNTIKFKLKGLTCEACVKLVTRYISKVPGVQNIVIDLATGEAEVTSTTAIDFPAIKQSLVGTEYSIIN